MAMVPYDCGTRRYGTEFHEITDEELADYDSRKNSSTLSDRLQRLLQCAREANEAGNHRLPLEDFLAHLRQEQETTTAVQMKATKSYMETVEKLTSSTLMNALGHSTRIQSEAVPVSRATQANLNPAYVQDLLAEVSDEAYELGFSAGKDEGIAEGEEEGRLMARLDGLTAGRVQMKVEGLKEGKTLEPQRGIGIGLEKIEWDEAATDWAWKGAGEMKGRVSGIIMSSTHTDEKVVVKMPLAKPLVKLPPVSHKAVLKPDAKENRKQANDPFQSLLELVRGK